jgi:hypothetical protein
MGNVLPTALLPMLRACSRSWLAALLALTAAGCATPVGVRRQDPRAVERQLASRALNGDDLSQPTLNVLQARHPTAEYADDPAAALAVEDGSDGVVEYKSAHVDGVESELVVRSGHSTQSDPRSIEEVRRILLAHAGSGSCAPPPSASAVKAGSGQAQ